MKKRAFFLLLLLLIPLTSILSPRDSIKNKCPLLGNHDHKPGSRIQNITPTDSRGRYHV